MPCSSTSRASTRRAVCCCLRQAVRSARSIASISGLAASSFGDRRTGVLRAPGATPRPAPPAPSVGARRAARPGRERTAPPDGHHAGSPRTTPPVTPTRPPASVVDHDYDGAGTPRPATTPGRVGGWGQIKPSPDLATTTSWSGWGHIKPSRWGRIRLTGAVLHGTRTPLHLWFWAAYLM